MLREMKTEGIIKVQEDETGTVLAYGLESPDEIGRQFIEQMLA